MPIFHHPLSPFQMFSKDSHLKSKVIRLSITIPSCFMITCWKKIFSKSSNLTQELISNTLLKNCHLKSQLSKENCLKCKYLSNLRILDKKITGTLDQSNGCLIIYHEQKKDVLYNGAGLVIENLLATV